ncbi:MAG: hypothetical protein KA319_02015 [Ferruginibacter sp.]|nr:hypothetical protein [Ferruginibacter sp.]
MQTESEKLLIEDAIYSLERSNESLETFTDYTAKEFHNKKMEFRLAEKVAKWEGVFDSILSISNEATKYIYETGRKYFETYEVSKLAYSKKAILKFQKEGWDTILYKIIYNYKKNLLSLNEDLTETFKKEIDSSFKDFTDYKKVNDYAKLHFLNIMDNQFYLKLTELKNKIIDMKLKLLQFCNIRCTIFNCGYFIRFNAIVGQNSTVFRKGDKVSISAGVGSFSLEAAPNISIANKKVDAFPEGVAVYEFQAPKKKGKYKVPVIIEYTRPDGIKEKREYKIEYEVVE